MLSLLAWEEEHWTRGVVRIAGVDEVGMGPLAGPVVAAAAILHPHDRIDGVNDSKQLDAEERTRLAEIIRSRAVAIGIGEASVEEIGRINILQAGLLAMRRALLALSPEPELVLVDARKIDGLPWPQEARIKADASVHCVACASVVAKVHRDAMMTALARPIRVTVSRSTRATARRPIWRRWNAWAPPPSTDRRSIGRSPAHPLRKLSTVCMRWLKASAHSIRAWPDADEVAPDIHGNRDDWSTSMADPADASPLEQAARRFRVWTDLEPRFRDTDAMGHVNNAVYVTYLEVAARSTGRGSDPLPITPSCTSSSRTSASISAAPSRWATSCGSSCARGT
ncbi:MAG: hypothetical protein R3E12_03155 [Candidatus Eisenbacteria bacterium]